MGFFRRLVGPDVGTLEAKKDIEALIVCLGSKNRQIRIDAAQALARIGKPAIDSLIPALNNKDENVVDYASGALQLMGDLALSKLVLALKDKDEQLKTKAASTLAHIRSKTAIEALLSACEEGSFDKYYVRAILITATGWKYDYLSEWENWWNQNKETWQYKGPQADHFIIRLHSPNQPTDCEKVIDEILEANGYIRGTATVDFQIASSIDNAYMTALILKHVKEKNREVAGSTTLDERRTKIHDFNGKASGKLVAVNYF
jgi:hypothetical protein